MSQITTEHVLFAGRVQGVGFRHTVRTIAKRNLVNGYVKNMADGTVELVIQGAPAALNALLIEVADHFRQNIADCQRHSIETIEEFNHFDIRF